MGTVYQPPVQYVYHNTGQPRLLAGYDAEGKRARSVCSLIITVLTFVMLSFLVAYCWRLYVGPYLEFHNKRMLLKQKAGVYLLSPTCTDPVLRAQLEDYNQCEESARIAGQWVSMAAFYDLMDYLRVCENGQCIIMGINLTDPLWTLMRVLIVVLLIAFIASFVGTYSAWHGRSAGMYQLPLTAVHMQPSGPYINEPT